MISITYDIFEIDTPINSTTYSEEYGYYIAPTDVKNIIKSYLEKEEYDHIFVAYKLGEKLHEEKISTGDWIGLGGMTYDGNIGYSNIRIPNENASLLYKYSVLNTFPEEVFIHEFLHGLERIENEYENNIPELHSYEKYGYKNNENDGLKQWYSDYMKSNITEQKIGLNKEVYIRKPIKESDFIETIDLTKENFYEPKNLLEEIKQLLLKIEEYINM